MSDKFLTWIESEITAYSNASVQFRRDNRIKDAQEFDTVVVVLKQCRHYYVGLQAIDKANEELDTDSDLSGFDIWLYQTLAGLGFSRAFILWIVTLKQILIMSFLATTVAIIFLIPGCFFVLGYGVPYVFPLWIGQGALYSMVFWGVCVFLADRVMDIHLNNQSRFALQKKDDIE